MEIHRAGSRASRRANRDYFTGTVWQDPIISPTDPARTSALRVTFEPGARTAWHTHPLGQVLHVTDGLGQIQIEGGPVEEIRPGDTIWIPPDVKHWHGATPDNAMVHIAIQEALDGTHIVWLEKVTDNDYGIEPMPASV